MSIGIAFNALVQSLTTLLFAFAERINAVLPKDGSEPLTGPLQLASYTTAGLPSAASFPRCIVWDSTAGTVKYSNGTTWTAV